MTRRRFTIRKVDGEWRWQCDMCWPPAHGRRRRWQAIIDISLPRHFSVRRYHHAWVARRFGGSPS